MEREIKVKFVIDKKELSKPYSITDFLIDKGYENVLDDMEVCTCQLNESNNHCECQSMYENSEITGIVQWTGLTDKNGKDIYEGDIVKEVYYPLNANPKIIEYYKLGIIVYTESYFGVQLKIDGSNVLDELNKSYHHKTVREVYKHPTQGENWVDKSVKSRLEIIGNIFSNPELLNP